MKKLFLILVVCLAVLLMASVFFKSPAESKAPTGEPPVVTTEAPVESSNGFNPANAAEEYESDFEPLPVVEEYVVDMEGDNFGEAIG